METISTNDAFHHILRLLQLHKDKDLILEIFASGGMEITKSKLKGWDSKSGEYREGFREMPRQALDIFIDQLYKRKLVTI